MSQEIPVLDYLVLKEDPAKFVQDLKEAASQWGNNNPPEQESKHVLM